MTDGSSRPPFPPIPHFSHSLVTDCQICLYRAGVTSENWQANATLSNGTAAGSLYIVPEAFNAVGVRDSAGVLEMNGTDTGFALFGTQLVYNNNSVIESQFWAQSTATEGIYALKWNTDGAMKENSFPVMVKAVENV